MRRNELAVRYAGEHPREPGSGFAGSELRCTLDQIKEERLLGGRGKDRTEVRILHHPVALNQRVDNIPAAEATVTTQPHGMKTFLEIDEIVQHH